MGLLVHTYAILSAALVDSLQYEKLVMLICYNNYKSELYYSLAEQAPINVESFLSSPSEGQE